MRKNSKSMGEKLYNIVGIFAYFWQKSNREI